MCVKKTALSCTGVTSSCERRMLVPRPASNCSFTAPQSLLSSPKRTNVPAPACPLKTAGPLCVPVNVTMRHGAACAVGAAVTAIAKKKAVTANIILVMISLPLLAHGHIVRPCCQFARQASPVVVLVQEDSHACMIQLVPMLLLEIAGASEGIERLYAASEFA